MATNPPSPVVTGDPRTDRALLHLARLLAEIARTEHPARPVAIRPTPPAGSTGMTEHDDAA